MADIEKVNQLPTPVRQPHVVGLTYMESDGEHPFRAIGIGFSDGVILTLTAGSISSLMSNEAAKAYPAVYLDPASNIVMNEQEHWFAGKDPFLTSKILI